ncbi:unnamed protein product [Owenia fusiformis]|uniref:SKICH domain-containing protein n=1 Tax=Owenia fusiformis TaxID=6347 RepID=A0A8S4N1I8_OWEFU|nr:unnamed protein product [Owenia fusiformis]
MATKSLSDFELEAISPSKDLVMFEDILEHYEPDQDIFVIYSLGHSYTASSRDWVGLFPSNWTTTRDYVTFEWAPKVPRNENFKDIRSVLFQAKNIQVEYNDFTKYQFLYVAKGNIVVGVSPQFKIHHCYPDDSALFTYDDFEDCTKLILNDYPPSKQKCNIDQFEVIGSSLSDTGISSGSHSSEFLSVDKFFPSNCNSSATILSKSDFPNIDFDDYVPVKKESSGTIFGNLFDDPEPNDDIAPSSKSSDSETLFGDLFNEHNKPEEGLKRTRDASTMNDIEDFGLKSLKIAKMECSILPVGPVVKDYYSKNDNRAVVPYTDRSIVEYKPLYSITKQDKYDTQESDLLMPVATTYFRKDKDDSNLQNDSRNTNEMNALQTQRECLQEFFKLYDRVQGPARPISVPQFYKQMIINAKPPAPRKPKNHKKKRICKECRKRVSELKALNKKTSDLEKQLSKIKLEVQAQDDTLNIKTILANELSKQVKNLVSENGKLTAANDRLYTRKSDLHYMGQENRKYLTELVKVKQQLGHLQDENLKLLHENGWMEHKLKISFEEKESIQDSYYQLEQKFSSLKETYEGLEKHLDDIMFTLSKKGFTRLIDTEGRTVELCGSKGTLIQLEGWNLAVNKKTERFMSRISELEENVVELKDDRKKLNKLVSEKELEVKEIQINIRSETLSRTKLQSELDNASNKLTEISNKESALSKLLIAEKKRKGDLIRQHLRRENQLTERIQSLQHALESSKLLIKQREMKRSNKQTQSEAVKATGVSVQREPLANMQVALRVPTAVDIFRKGEEGPLVPEPPVTCWADACDQHNNNVTSASCVIEIPEDEDEADDNVKSIDSTAASLAASIVQAVTTSALEKSTAVAKGVSQAIFGNGGAKPKAVHRRPFFRTYTGHKSCIGRGNSTSHSPKYIKPGQASRVITTQVKPMGAGIKKEKCPHCCVVFPLNFEQSKIDQHIEMHEKYTC